MSHHLLAISIGPVQEFIAAARRTADLYAGSQLLVEIARTIARVIEPENQSRSAYGKLIFPAMVIENGQSKIKDGPNKILAEITNGDPSAIAEACRKAALEYLRGDGQGKPGIWGKAKKEIPELDEPLADAQIETFIEFYAAWLPWDGSDNTYEEVRINLDRLLAGRKALRDFQQPMTRAGRPKSPLDPSRDCALKISGTEPVPIKCQTDPLWLKQRETLDALSLLKRVRGNKLKEVPATSLMAAQAILPAVRKLAGQSDQWELQHALHEMDNLVKDTPAGIDMGDLMFLNRLQEEIEILQKAQETRDDAGRKDALQLLENPNISAWRGKILEAAKTLGYRGSECPPYYAILVADGDKMGALIGELKDIEKHRKFSAALSRFAEEAKKIVGDCNGHLVYSGGDDVLALLPVNQVLDCAAALAGKFRSILESETDMKAVLDQLQKEGKTGGTLSVGIAIVHHMDPVLVSLEHARSAEKEAKKLRNAFAVALHTRGGEPLTTSQQWDNNYTVNDWKQWINAFRNGLARGFPYELRTLAREFQADGMPVSRLQVEADRIYQRKEGSATVPLPDFKENPKVMGTFAKKLVIARFLSTYEVKA